MNTPDKFKALCLEYFHRTKNPMILKLVNEHIGSLANKKLTLIAFVNKAKAINLDLAKELEILQVKAKAFAMGQKPKDIVYGDIPVGYENSYHFAGIKNGQNIYIYDSN